MTSNSTLVYDSAGQLSQVGGSLTPGGPSTTLFSAISYIPAGAIGDAVLGSGITLHRDYNSRLLPTDEVDKVATVAGSAIVQVAGQDQLFGFSTGSLTFSGSENSMISNGQTLCDGGLFLVSVNNAQPIQVTYGQYSTKETLAATVASLLTCSSGPVQAAAVGATVYLLSCQPGNNTRYSISAQNAPATQRTVSRRSTVNRSISNDASGARVAKLDSNGAITSTYILGAGGQQMTEYNASGVWQHSDIYTPGGRLLATYTAGTSLYPYNLTDWLGTKRMQTNASGNQEEICTSLPFGDSLTCTGAADASEHHFTGKDRDTETGLDYFGARYFSSSFGRFMTPDWSAVPINVPYAKFGDPQSLNLYAYVENNPNTGIDIDGHEAPAQPWYSANGGYGYYTGGSYCAAYFLCLEGEAAKAYDADPPAPPDNVTDDVDVARQQSGAGTVAVTVGRRPIQNK